MTAPHQECPHRRLNVLTGDWVLVSPQRTLRPWLGRREGETQAGRPEYDPQCSLCPGNVRAGGAVNPRFTETFVFTNDFPALLPAGAAPRPQPHPLFHSDAVRGTCRVVCFSPRHDLTLPQMAVEQIGRVIAVWAEQTQELGEQYRWVQVFENKGDVMGCSNPHPHGQIWASDGLPNEPAKEDLRQRAYWQAQQSRLLVDYGQHEADRQERVVLADEHWLAVVPYWATWPFELLLLPRRPVSRLPDLTPVERRHLAEVLKRLLTRYDNLFATSFPYSMGWHGAPYGDSDVAHWQIHAHFYPPLLRSATVKKFMVGYEMLAEAQRDLTPEQAAARLREQSEVHYLDAQQPDQATL
jgi:UDPglucose--hexose-1-phosphate uridylyltransferase